MSDQNTILPDILSDETKIFILSAVLLTLNILIIRKGVMQVVLNECKSC